MRQASPDGTIVVHPVENHGLTVASGYIRFWQPILGPTSTLLYLDLHRSTRQGGCSAKHDVRELASDLGVGMGLSSSSPLARAIDRLVKFGLLDPTPDPGCYTMRANLPYLSGNQLDRLRPWMSRQAIDFASTITDEFRVTVGRATKRQGQSRA